QRVLQVLQQPVHHVNPSLLAVGFTKHSGAAEPLEGRATRVGRRPAAAQVLVNQQLEVRPQFLVELAVEPLTAERGSAPRPRDVQPSPERDHPSDLSLARTRPITAARRSQYSVCATSCFSPALVIT